MISAGEVDHSEEMNTYVNTYFKTENFDEIEKTLAGDMEVEDLIPVRELTTTREINELGVSSFIHRAK